MIAFVLPLTTDPRINRRLNATVQLGIEATVFAFERAYFHSDPPAGGKVPVIPLGRVRHGAYLRRLPTLLAAVFRLLRHRRTLRRARAIYVVGTDCLAVTRCALALGRVPTPVIYEIADIRDALSRPDLVGAVLRWGERRLLARVERIVVTSVRFRDAYYAGMQGRDPDTVTVLENKLFPPVPERRERDAWDGRRPLAIGYFGLLRFQEGWDSLMALARRFPDRVRVYVRGHRMALSRFEEDLALPNVEYGGPYVSPDDLAELYGRVDALWIVYDAARRRNLAWADANRFYEAIHYRVPLVACDGTYVAERVRDHGIGWVIPHATAAAAEAWLESLTPERLAEARAACAAHPSGFSFGTKELLEFFGRLGGVAPPAAPP